MSKEKKSKTVYSEAFKWQVVQEVLSGNVTKESAKTVYGIKSNCAVLYWMRTYSGNTDCRNERSSPNSQATMGDSKEQQELRERVKQLEEELRRANLRADLWQKMVEVAEERLKIDIKKKFGARPSGPSGRGGRAG